MQDHKIPNAKLPSPTELFTDEAFEPGKEIAEFGNNNNPKVQGLQDGLSSSSSQQNNKIRIYSLIEKKLCFTPCLNDDYCIKNEHKKLTIKYNLPITINEKFKFPTNEPYLLVSESSQKRI